MEDKIFFIYKKGVWFGNFIKDILNEMLVYIGVMGIFLFLGVNMNVLFFIDIKRQVIIKKFFLMDVENKNK